MKSPNVDVLHSVESTLDFVGALKSLIDYGGEIEIEPKGNKGDVDVKAIIDGKTMIFQVKTLYSLKSKIMSKVLSSSIKFMEKHLNKFGVFVKALFGSQQGFKFVPEIIRYRKVNANVDVSYGSFLYPVDFLMPWTLRRVLTRIKRSYPQLKDVDADYRVTVVDARMEPINEFTLLSETQLWLVAEGHKYRKLSGVIFMKFYATAERHQVSTWLIPVINPYAESPLDLGLLLKNIILPRPFSGTRYLLILPVRIHLHAHKWNTLLEVKPRFRLTYEDVYFGTII